MTSKNNKRQYLRCPGCGKQPVPLKRGRLSSHLTPGGIKCHWIGQPEQQARRFMEAT